MVIPLPLRLPPPPHSVSHPITPLRLPPHHPITPSPHLQINAALNGALTALPLTATECRVIGGPLAAWWFVPWPRSCGGGGGVWRCCCGCGARGWQLDQELVGRTVGCIRRVSLTLEGGRVCAGVRVCVCVCVCV